MADDYTARTRTELAALAGAGLLLVVLVVGGTWLVGRAVTGGASSPMPLPEGPASQEPAVEGAVLVAGVPWGFALDEAGAVAAASAAITVTAQPDVAFDPDRFAEVAEVVFTPDEAAVQVRQVDAARTQFELSGWADQPVSRRMYHLAPLSVRLTAFDPDGVTARVEVWAMTLVGVGDTGGAVFTTSTVDLSADEAAGTWRVTSLDSQEGPVPLVYDSPSAPGRTRMVVRDAIPLLPLPYPTITRPSP